MREQVIWSSPEAIRVTLRDGEMFTDPRYGRSIDPKSEQHLRSVLALTDEERLGLVPPPTDAQLTAYRLVEVLCMFAHRRLCEGAFSDALCFYDFLTLVPRHHDGTLYQNALYAVMDDNHHLGVMPERARRYLERCLPNAPRFPAIFYNASGVWLELGDADASIACVRDAIRYGYANLDQIRTDATLVKALGADPRFTSAFDDPSLLAEQRERIMPPSLRALRDVDQGDPALEIHTALEAPEKTFARIVALGAPVAADRLRVFGDDARGGVVAFWRTDPALSLDEEPIVHLGSDGRRAVLARDLADFVVLLEGGIDPVEPRTDELVEQLAGVSFRQVKNHLAKYHPSRVGRTVAQAVDAARAAAPDFPTSR
ncbi:MAG: hypothetical protein BGO98_11315 [Myxococcales bacterium 68-20]|nr:hypothetical protein [Myxococcales bacterium]OJY16776.1 MAG: hypothetical protein BGO98_11315 [Myxococcales bacterium 68-20]